MEGLQNNVANGLFPGHTQRMASGQGTQRPLAQKETADLVIQVGCDLSGVDLLLQVSCSIGRVATGGEQDIEVFVSR